MACWSFLSMIRSLLLSVDAVFRLFKLVREVEQQQLDETQVVSKGSRTNLFIREC